jgi:hypothetical protein
MIRESLIAVTASAVLLTGCSSTPRSFSPELAAAPVDQAAYERVLADCQALAAQTQGSGSGRLASAGAGVAGGAAAGAVGLGATGGTYSTYGAAFSAGGAAVAAVPVVGLVAAWGLSRINRGKKERRIKRAAQDCLATEGYLVADWHRVRDRHVAEEVVEASETGEVQDSVDLAVNQATLETR